MNDREIQSPAGTPAVPPTGIRRVDSERSRTQGWHVFIQRRGRKFTRHFADGAHGGRAQAYAAALAFLNRVQRTEPGLLRSESADILRRNNTSGVPGVCRYRRGKTLCWVAFWPTAPGQSRKVSFSVAKYGEEKTFALALAARKRALEQLAEPRSRTYGKRRRPQPEPAARQDWSLDAAGETLVWKRLGVTVTVAELLKTA